MMAEQNREVAELMKLLPGFVEEQIPFNKVLGLRVESLDMESVSLKIGMKEELIGNPVKGILHGGVISAVLDVTGGITEAMGVLKRS
jgi:acyl-coenzyme A thioesterase PaaI-like protein